jgi:hypothetical protein
MMSKGRMNDLLHSLESDGWALLNPQNMFLVENEAVTWNLEHAQTKTKADIAFYLFGHFGEPTDSLRDILYCVVRHRRTIKLYFDKRESDDWKHSMSKFVEDLRSYLREGKQRSS